MTGADDLVARGTAHFNAGRVKEALADFRAAARQGRGTPQLRYFAAHAELALGRLPEALADFAKLVKTAPTFLPAYVDLANMLHKQGRLIEATNTLKALLKRDPSHAVGRARLAELEGAQAGEARTATLATRARRPASKRAGKLLVGRPMIVPEALSTASERTFKIPGGPLRVKRLGNLPIELLALIAGVKPVIHATTRPGDLPELEQLAHRLKLDLHRFPLGVMLGRDPRAMREAASRWDREDFNPGAQLGYPPCCAAWYFKHADVPGSDIVRETFKHTKKKTRLPFALNNVFYFFSRVSSVQESARRQKLAAMNPGLDLDVLNLIPWHPCAYDCKPSRAKAAKIWKVARKAAPGLASALKVMLSRRVVFWDWSRFAVLKHGTCAVEAPYSLLEKSLVASLERADEIVSTPKGLELRKNGKRLGLLGGKPAPILLDFSA